MVEVKRLNGMNKEEKGGERREGEDLDVPSAADLESKGRSPGTGFSRAVSPINGSHFLDRRPETWSRLSTCHETCSREATRSAQIRRS